MVQTLNIKKKKNILKIGSSLYVAKMQNGKFCYINNSEFKESEHPRDKEGRFTSKGSGKEGFSKKPKSNIVHKGVQAKVESFRGKSEGTYDLATGKQKEYSNGYCVSFHQNEPDEKGNYKSHMGRYTEKEYDDITNELQNQGLEVNVGVFDNEPEVSFWTKDRAQAINLMVKYNQYSIYDVETGDFIENPFYDKTKNPMRGD